MDILYFQFEITFTRTSTSIWDLPVAVNDTNEIFGTIFHGLHPADNIDSIIDKHRVLINDSRINVGLEPDYPNYPAKVAGYSSDCIPFQIVANSALEVYKDGKIIPGPMGGPNYKMSTDSAKHYWSLTDNVYRFSPIVLTRDDISMWHGMNEKISVENYNQVK